ncbi:hypothetical protein GTO10_02525 [Candidatus Saccharibacteria bacterium]|nr:hypothetical protein [Candidatus Saccharibacteria bacterium]
MNRSEDRFVDRLLKEKGPQIASMVASLLKGGWTTEAIKIQMGRGKLEQAYYASRITQ